MPRCMCVFIAYEAQSSLFACPHSRVLPFYVCVFIAYWCISSGLIPLFVYTVGCSLYRPRIPLYMCPHSRVLPL